MLNNASIIWHNRPYITFLFIFAAVKQNYLDMTQTFLFTLFRYYNGSWVRSFELPHLTASLKRKQISRLKSFGFKYEPSFHGYVLYSENGHSAKIAYFTKGCIK